MKKGVEYTGKVVGISFPNKGKVDCKEEGMATVKGVIPGQTVRFVVSKKRSGNAVGRLKEVVEKSPLEDVSPACPHFENCGGCAFNKSKGCALRNPPPQWEIEEVQPNG